MYAPDGFIEELIERYHDPLYKQCKRIVKYNPLYMELIDDCIQEVFFKAYFDYDSLTRSGNTYGWLVVCCENYFRSLYRKNKRRGEIAGIHVSIDQYGDIKDPTDAIIRWLERAAAKTVLNELKSKLTPLELSVFQHYYEKGQTMKETAIQNNMSNVSVRAALDRIRSKLKKMPFYIFIFVSWCISLFSRTI